MRCERIFKAWNEIKNHHHLLYICQQQIAESSWDEAMESGSFHLCQRFEKGGDLLHNNNNNKNNESKFLNINLAFNSYFLLMAVWLVERLKMNDDVSFLSNCLKSRFWPYWKTRTSSLPICSLSAFTENKIKVTSSRRGYRL